MPDTDGLEAVLAAHQIQYVPHAYPEWQCECDWQGNDAAALTHQADAVRAWLLGQREAVAITMWGAKIGLTSNDQEARDFWDEYPPALKKPLRDDADAVLGVLTGQDPTHTTTDAHDGDPAAPGGNA